MMIDDDGCDNDDDTDDDGCDNCMVHVALMMMESSKLEINPSIHPTSLVPPFIVPTTYLSTYLPSYLPSW